MWKCNNCGLSISVRVWPIRCACGNVGYESGIQELINEDNRSKITIPTISTRINNFTTATVKHIKSGRPHCSDEQRKERFEICKSDKCGMFVKRGDGGICAHQKCGCILRSEGWFMDKLSWADSECPLGLWKSVSKVSENSENGV